MSQKNGKPWFKPKWEEWTPAKARKALAVTDKAADPSKDTSLQRRLNWHYVLKLAEDMRLGDFNPGTDGIDFDDDGVCTNGRHRLYAIVESNTTQWLLTTRGVPKKYMIGRDDGLKRSESAALRIAGMDYAGPHICAAAKLMAIAPGTDRLIWTKTNLQEFIARNKTALQFAIKGLGYGKSVGVSGTHAAVARAWYHMKVNVLEQLCDILRTGLYDCPREDASPAISLRNWLLRGAPPSSAQIAQGRGRYGGGAWNIVIYRKAQRVIRAWDEGEELSRIYEEMEDLYPLPSDKAPKAAKRPTQKPRGRVLKDTLVREKSIAGVAS